MLHSLSTLLDWSQFSHHVWLRRYHTSSSSQSTILTNNTHPVEHGIKATATQAPTPRRPDLSTFFSALDQVDTSGTRQPQNSNSIPLPGDISAAYRLLASAFDTMRGPGAGADTGHNELMERLVEQLMVSADHPPTEVQGVPDEFVTGLDRIPKTKLKKDGECPICGNLFLEDKFPLVVELPCGGRHAFDLECIEPWLKLNPTCPMDREVVWKRKEKPVKKVEDEEEEYDDMFG